MCRGFQNEGKKREKEGEKKIDDLVSKRVKRKGLKRKNIRERERERETFELDTKRAVGLGVGLGVFDFSVCLCGCGQKF